VLDLLIGRQSLPFVVVIASCHLERKAIGKDVESLSHQLNETKKK
jgi:hypothetical protein